MNLSLPKKLPLPWLYLGGAILLVVALVLWCTKISTDPERAFWRAIDQGMATHGVTILSEQENNDTTLKQTMRYSMGAENRSHTLTVLEQAGTKVKNETISTQTADYTRYVDIKTDQKRADGSPMDFSKLLGVWAKGEEGSGQFFAQALFGTSLPAGGTGVPIGYIDAEQRAELLQQIRNDNVYQIDFSKVKKERVDGRLRYTYDATIQPSAYVALIKSFAQSAGLHTLDQLEPEDYKGQKPFKLAITVDVKARHVVHIAAPETGGKQTYTAYDIPVQIDLPQQAISGAELQKRLSELR